MSTIRRLALALVAAVALGALGGAANAGASQFTAESYPATLKGNEATLGGFHSLIYWGGGSSECTLGSMEKSISSPAGSVMMAPSSISCWDPFYGSGPMKLNGCEFTFAPGSQAVEEISSPEHPPEFGGAFGIACPAGKSVVMELGICDVTISPKSGLSAEFENNPAYSGEETQVRVEAEGLEWKGTGTCSGEGKEMRWYPAWNLKATNKSGVGIGERVSNGLSVSGPPKFSALSYPAYTQTLSEAVKFEIPGVDSINCASSQLWSTLSVAVAQGTVNGTFAGCTSGGGLPTLAKANSCKLNLGILNAGPPYKGTVGLSCSKEGDYFEYAVYAGSEYKVQLCSVKLFAQSGHEGLELTNTAWPPGIDLDGNIGSFSWTKSGTCGSASGSNGVFKLADVTFIG